MQKYYKKRSLSKFQLQTRIKSQKLIKSELEKYKILTEEQFKLRLLGMDIELTAIVSKKNPCDYYLGSLVYIDSKGNSCWVRVDNYEMDIDKKTYNNVLSDCLIKAKEIISEGNFLKRKKVF